MSIYISDIVEENTIDCNVCKKTFNTNEITTDDFNFAWDNYVTTDCCSNCSHKFLVEKMEDKNNMTISNMNAFSMYYNTKETDKMPQVMHVVNFELNGRKNSFELMAECPVDAMEKVKAILKYSYKPAEEMFGNDEDGGAE